MTYVDVCTGLSAATVAWHPLGWQPVCFAEIELFPSAVLTHHYPEVPNVGDFTAIRGDEYGAIDLLVGGTPCQDFSVAGLRAGMDGKRGQLTVEYAHLAGRLRTRWLVWENVPGVLSIDEGRAFGTFLRMLGKLGYGLAYRVLDAQHFGVPQRRRRVFVVGHLGDWRRAAAVLFERHSLSGYPAPRREAGQGFTHDLAPSLTSSGRGVERGGDSRGQNPVVPVYANLRLRESRAGGQGRSSAVLSGMPDSQLSPISESGMSHAVGRALVSSTGDIEVVAVAISENQRGEVLEGDVAGSLQVSGGKPGQGYAAARIGMAVRRLTPRECERLQGFPDDYTLIRYHRILKSGKLSKRLYEAADGPRYKALGNSMAVPVMRWIGERIQTVEEL